MMEMEPFPFYQEDAMGAAAAASASASAAMEELFPWDFRGFSDLVSPAAFDPSLLQSEEDMLLWGMPLAEEYATSLGPPPPPPPPPELLQWATSPVTEAAAAPAPPVLLEQPPVTLSVRRSAFVVYERARYNRGCRRSGGENIHRRMAECLRKIPVEKPNNAAVERSSRCFRHMMRERQRRERLSQSYSDLHSMIVPRPKANKNAIVLSAAAYVRELKSTREALQKRYQELRVSLGEGGAGRPEGATIKLRVGNPTSPVDSMIAALRQLKGMDVRARHIRSCADGRELSAVINVETKMARKEVEKAVEGALVETERQLRSGSARTNVDHAGASSMGWWSHPATWPNVTGRNS